MDDAAPALALARSALGRANEAMRKAEEGVRKGDSAIEGYRTLYEALGEVAAEVAKIAKGLEELAAWVKRAVHDSLRPPAPSQHDLAQVAAIAATKAAEETGRHIVVPSDRIRAVNRADRHEAIAKAAIKVFWILLTAAVGVIVGKLWR